MARKLAGRVLFSFFVMLALTFFVFLMSNLVKGNQLDVQLAGDITMSKETYDALLHKMGLDLPIPVRYWKWLTGFLRGDMGTSSQYNVPVLQLIGQRLGPTLLLTLSALFLAVVIAIPLGVMSAYKPYSAWDNLSSFVAFVSSSMPGFVLCLFAVYFFAVKLGWFPTQGMYANNMPRNIGNLLHHLTLPACIAGTQMIGGLLKQTRSAVLEVMNEEYVKTARSKGLGEFVVVVRHALRNALIPIVTQISLSVPFLVGGSVVIEQIFSWPGMGSMMINGILARDYNVIMAGTVVICTVVLVANILLDFLYMLINPRIARGR